MQALQHLLYRGTLVVLDRLSSVYGDDSVSQEMLPTVLEVVGHVRNRSLTAANGRQSGILSQTVRNWLRRNVQPIRAYLPYFGQILTRRYRMARRDWCRRHLHFRRAD